MGRKPLLAVGFCILISNSTMRGLGVDLHRPDESGEYSVAFAPDGKWLVTGGGDGRVRIRDGTTGEMLADLAGHETNSKINALAVSPDGRTIASASDDFSARLWDVQTRAERRALLPPPPTWDSHCHIISNSYCVLSVAFAPDGRTVATGDNGGFVKLWDVVSGEPSASWTADPRRVNQVLYSPDGSTIASVGNDSAVKLWDARSHALRRTIPHPEELYFQMAYSPDGATLAVSHGRGLTLWNPATGEAKQRFRDCPGYCPALAFTPDGDYLAVADRFRSDLCSVKSRPGGDDPWTEIIGPSDADGCSAIAVSPDGRWVAHCFSKLGRMTPKTSFKLVAIR